MLNRNSKAVYLHNLIDLLETLEVIYDGLVSDDIIDLIKQAKSLSQMELKKAKERKE